MKYEKTTELLNESRVTVKFVAEEGWDMLGLLCAFYYGARGEWPEYQFDDRSAQVSMLLTPEEEMRLDCYLQEMSQTDPAKQPAKESIADMSALDVLSVEAYVDRAVEALVSQFMCKGKGPRGIVPEALKATAPAIIRTELNLAIGERDERIEELRQRVRYLEQARPPKDPNRLDVKIYGRLFKTKDDTEINPDEYIVFRAHDNALLPILEHYRDLCQQLGAGCHQLANINGLRQRVTLWRNKHQKRCKVADFDLLKEKR